MARWWQSKWNVRRMANPDIVVLLDVLDNDNQSNIEGDRYEDQDDTFAYILTLFRKLKRISRWI